MDREVQSYFVPLREELNIYHNPNDYCSWRKKSQGQRIALGLSCGHCVLEGKMWDRKRQLLP